jgi:hypothetical protein
MTREVKKLSWFQRNILCMKVELHQDNYQAYVERKDICDTQKPILHKLSGEKGNPPTATPATAYQEDGTLLDTTGMI